MQKIIDRERQWKQQPQVRKNQGGENENERGERRGGASQLRHPERGSILVMLFV